MGEFSRGAQIFWGIVFFIIGIVLIPTLGLLLAGTGDLEKIVIPLFPMTFGIILIIVGLKGDGNSG